MTLNHYFMISAFIALLFGLGVSFILARQLTSPLSNITKAANEMRRGNLAVRSNVNLDIKVLEVLE